MTTPSPEEKLVSEFPIELTCSNCGHKATGTFKVECSHGSLRNRVEELEGKIIKCPDCNSYLNTGFFQDERQALRDKQALAGQKG